MRPVNPVGAVDPAAGDGAGAGAGGRLRVHHDVGRSLTATWDGVDLMTYVYDGRMPASEAPKPYVHPLRTRSGALVSAYRPHDHRWHKGLQMTVSNLSGENFWGGPTYVHGQGYVPLDNVGSMRHVSFERLAVDPAAVDVQERLAWWTAAGERWVDERRRLRLHGLEAEDGSWVLDVDVELTNVRGQELAVGSPTTQGRPLAGYTGLFWRGPRAWTGGEVLASDGRSGEGLMGEASPWLSFSGDHDDVDGGGTVVVVARRSPDAAPTRWFVRSEPFPALNPSPAFDEEVVVAPGGSLALSHRVVVADRRWGREEVESCLARLAP